MKKFFKENILLLVIMIFMGSLSYMVGLRDKELMRQEKENNIINIEK